MLMLYALGRYHEHVLRVQVDLRCVCVYPLPEADEPAEASP